MLSRRQSVRRSHRYRTTRRSITGYLDSIFASVKYPSISTDKKFTYGEITWSAMQRIVQIVKAGGKKGAFYDLGCGRGKAVLYASLSGMFTKSVGVELVEERALLAKQAVSALKRAHSPIEILTKSFLDDSVHLSDAAAIFISNLCLDSETNQQLFSKLNKELSSGAHVFCSKLPESISGFTEAQKEPVAMSWSQESTLYSMRKI